MVALRYLNVDCMCREKSLPFQLNDFKGSDWIRLVFAHPFPLNKLLLQTSFQMARFMYLHMGLLHHTHS